jgi:16S rRNA (cytidine1402-2'-O)-methyltransferase
VVPTPMSTVPSTQVGALFIVSLPTGNPEDITLRALRILRDVSLVVAENGRSARSLLDSWNIDTEVVSQAPRGGRPAHIAALSRLNEGHDVALVADSGTPTLLDPGLSLVALALKNGCRVTAAPGATACMTALAISGMPSIPFCFLGFPPRREPERAAFFATVGRSGATVVLYESRRFLRSTVTELTRSVEKARKIVVACDLTHTNEWIFRGTISTAATKFAGHNPPGAYTVVVAGRTSSADR